MAIRWTTTDAKELEERITFHSDRARRELEEEVAIARLGNEFFRALADADVSVVLRMDIAKKIKWANQYDVIGWVDVVAECIASEHSKAMRRYFKHDNNEDRRRVEDCNTAQNLLRKTKVDMHDLVLERNG